MSVVSFNKEKTMQASEPTVKTVPAKPVVAVVKPLSTTATAAAPLLQKRGAWAATAKRVFEWLLPPVTGLLIFAAIWATVSALTQGLPGPVKTWQSAVELFSDPFYINNPNDMGIGWNILNSLKRVATGFALAAVVGIPMGFVIGRYTFMSRMAAPVISLLKPVSPLAWLPIGLLVFKAANPAAIWVIFITAVWPMIINTAVGVSKVPQDYMNVAKVLNLSEWKIVTKILLPYVMPYMMTGVRLSIGAAWLVIVAAEMLTGGVGIGFWVWDEWNNLNVEHIIIAIFIVGIVGLLLEQCLVLVAKRYSYE
ncbi:MULTISPECIES: nitrate ABC transporter permease [Methylophilus]|uniref:nitrate ABC transporter permease n=1 Tax=Methylophilus TaxID=16 RepID=UPI0003A7503F|nr:MULTISPECIES: nitrate ABC transporter permease [Methylophilus]PPD12531.1 MAG: nitrate ABC transporter, permease protein [Methylophilus sp.]